MGNPMQTENVAILRYRLMRFDRVPIFTHQFWLKKKKKKAADSFNNDNIIGKKNITTS